MNFKIDKFVLAIGLALIMAYLFPSLGLENGPIPLDEITTAGVFLIFFFYGLKLSPEKLKEGLSNWKLHVVIQLSTFLLFPLLVIAFYPFITSETGKNIWMGLLFLAALPSTVSFSVVMVAVAKGNVPAAIFNASISGIIGILVTPLWLGLFIQKSEVSFDFSSIYQSLLVGILLPLIIGISLQKWCGKWAQKNSKQLSFFDKTIILLIIYKSFARAFEEKTFSTVGTIDLLLLLLIILSLFFTVYHLIGSIARKLKFNKADQIAAQFCGTKKSLVHGTVFYAVLFGDTENSGLILLPLMLFHACQILIVSFLAEKIGRKNIL